MGALHFKEDGKVAHVGEWTEANCENMDEHPFGRCYTRGPNQSAREYLLSEWDDLEGAANWRVADLEILRLAVESIPDYFNDGRPYTLEWPDYDLQNILVDEDANVTGMIDWDLTITRPFGLGFARYPSWILCDWNPAHYVYDLEDGSHDDEKENSPEELLRFRKHYAGAFAKLDRPRYDPRETELSHLMVAINTGVHDRFCRQYIAEKLLDFAFKSNWPCTYRHCLGMVRSNECQDIKQEIVEAFKRMWHTEGEQDSSPRCMTLADVEKGSSTQSVPGSISDGSDES